MTDQEKLILENEVEQFQKEHREAKRIIEQTRREVIASNDMLVANKKAVEEEKEKLTAIINEIASQKLEWALQKETETKELEEKKGAVDAILAKEADLIEKEALIEKKTEQDREVLRKNDQAILAQKGIVIANEAVLKEISEQKEKVIEIGHENDKKMADFRAKVLSIIKDIENI